MNNIKTTFDYEISESDNKLYNRFRTFAVTPVFWGIFIFAIFFSVILLTKLFTFFISESSIFNLNIYDILFSLIGFGFGFLIEFALQLRKEFLK